MVMRTAMPLMLLALSIASCGPADERRTAPATPSPLMNPTAPEVTSTTTRAPYASSVLVVGVPSAESITVYNGQLVIAQVMSGARPPQTSSQLLTVPISGGVPAVITGTYREGGVAVTSVATGLDGVYVTSASNSRLSDNEVYRLAGGVHTTIAAGPGSPTTLSGGNGDGGPATSSMGGATGLPARKSTFRARNQMRAGRVTARWDRISAAQFAEGLSCLPWPGKSSW